MKPADWKQKFEDAAENLQHIRSLTEEIASQVGSALAVSTLLKELLYRTDEVARTNRELGYFFSMEPVERLVMGQMLSQEAFYILLALGGIEPTSYESFKLWHYKDESVRGYIDPKAPPPDVPMVKADGSTVVRGRVHVGGFIDPENVEVRYLTEAQREFFRTHYPDVYRRFRTT